MFKKVDKLLIVTGIVVIMLGISLVLVNFVNIKINAKSSEQMNVNYSTTESNTWDVSKSEDGSVIATLSDDGILTISGTGDMKDWNSPSEISWYNLRDQIKQIIIEEGITSIGYGAFTECYCLTNIEIPNSVIVIGDWAFSDCSQLTNIEIPSSVTSIGPDTFYYCYSLRNIDVKDGNTKYCDVNGVLYSKDKTEIIRYPMGKTETEYTILNSVTSIGYSAFEECSQLMKIEIPDGVINIGEYAFYYCENLTDIEIPSSVLEIGSYAFDGCKITKFLTAENSAIEIPNILKRVQDETDILYSSQEFTLTNCVIEDGKIKINEGEAYAIIGVEDGLLEGLTFIISYNSWDVSETGDKSLIATLDENGLFTISGTGGMKDFGALQDFPWYDVSDLIRKLKIEEGVTSVKLYAFNYCYYLTNVEIPSSVINLGEEEAYILYLCYCLTDISVDSNNTKYCDDNGVLYTKDKTELMKYPIGRTEEEYKILDGVKTIHDVAFEEAWFLTSIEIPNSVIEIGSYAFASCYCLENVTLPEGLAIIGEGAFYWCEKLETITIPKSVTEIGHNVVKYCDYVTILCYKDSYAETYAQENELKYQIIYLSSTEQTIDEQNLVIKGIKPETSIEKLRTSLQSDISYEILDQDGNIIGDTSTFVATGYQLKLSNDQKYTIVVKGDINGDGKAKLSDLSKLKLSVIGKTQLEGAYKEAADINGDGNVKLSDLSKMKLYLVGNGTL